MFFSQQQCKNYDFMEAFDDDYKTVKDRPVEMSGNLCKAKLAFIAKMKREASPILQFIPPGKR